MSETSNPVVLDASAVLAFLNREPGWETVHDRLQTDTCFLSTVNFSEIVGKLAQKQSPFTHRLAELIDLMGVELVAFDMDTALQAGLLTSLTQKYGLSLGDRSCIATAMLYRAKILTADQAWFNANLPVELINLRKP